jgi:hypothetical protein
LVVRQRSAGGSYAYGRVSADVTFVLRAVESNLDMGCI